VASLVSCIVPVFNGERYLAEALQSIAGQTYRPIEILVVDDGSTDRTPEIAAQFSPGVRCLRQANAGPAAARNRGLDAAAGEFVAFLDADDLWHPEKLARQVEHFGARPDLDMSLTLVQNFWVPELAEEGAELAGHRVAQPAPGFSPVALLARRSLFDEVGRFEESWRHIHDTEWFVRARDCGKISDVLPEVLVRRRLHPDNRSRRFADASRDEYLQLTRRRIARRGATTPHT
jgi:glycosyltransferase involved in cell wall biosynthesis